MGIFILYVEVGNYFAAVNKFETMRDDPSKYKLRQADLDILQPTYDQIMLLKAADGPYSIEGRIDETSHWFATLNKAVFYFDRVEGELEELKLRCQGAYRVFPYQEDATYAIPESWGECDLQVIGSPETKFYINQQ